MNTESVAPISEKRTIRIPESNGIQTLDEAAINRQLHRLGQVRVELNEERSRFIAGVRKILSWDRSQRRQPIYNRSR